MISTMQALSERLQEEQSLRKTLESRIQGSPKGKIHVSVEKGYPRCYRVLDGQKTYLGNRDLLLAKSLAEKSYYQDLLRETESEIKLLRYFLAHFDPEAGIKTYEEMHDYRKKLVTPLILPADRFAAEWLEKHRAMAAARPNVFEIKNGFPTENGEMVRSKSEKILAEHFLHSGVLYVYECPLQLTDGTVYPDFTILNLRTRKVYYWEHCGMMDSSEYLNPMLQKIFRYERSGIFIGNQLILSMETSSVPLNMQQVDLLIRTYLL